MNKTLSLSLIYMVLLFVTISFVSAGAILDQEYNLSVSCLGFNCSAINITILSPDSSIVIDNQLMTDKTFYATYSLTPNMNGQYTFYYSDGTNSSTGNFIVTPNGEEFNSSQSIIYIIILLADLLVLAVFLYFSFYIPYDNEKKDTHNGPAVTKVTKTKYIKLMCIWISYYLILVFVTILTGIANNYLSFEPVQIMVTNVFIFGTFLGYGVSTFMVWFIFFNIWKDIILNKIILKEGMAVIRDLK